MFRISIIELKPKSNTVPFFYDPIVALKGHLPMMGLSGLRIWASRCPFKLYAKHKPTS